MSKSIEKYSAKVRVRVCGMLLEEEKILLIKHKNLGPKGYIWSPPGGGMEFQESAEETLVREFKEETGLDIEVKQFLFVNEYKDRHYHAMELFFSVLKKGGILKLGSDPELQMDNQILDEINWFSSKEIKQKDPDNLHNAFRYTDDPQKVVELRGFFKFVNISVK